MLNMNYQKIFINFIQYPECDPEVPGCARGPCPTDSGLPSDVESEQGDSTVYFSNIKFGCIDCTY